MSTDKERHLKPILSIRGTKEWNEWVNALAKHAGLSKSDLVDVALSELFPDEEIPKRTGD